MSEITAEADDETLDADQKDEFKELAGEVKELDEHLERLNICLKAEATAAKPVVGATQEDGHGNPQGRAGADPGERARHYAAERASPSLA